MLRKLKPTHEKDCKEFDQSFNFEAKTTSKDSWGSLFEDFILNAIPQIYGLKDFTSEEVIGP